MTEDQKKIREALEWLEKFYSEEPFDHQRTKYETLGCILTGQQFGWRPRQEKRW